MNVYFALSESIEHVEWEDWSVNAGHREDYCICEFVRAKNRAQAKYLAWQNDPGTHGERMEDMPRMSVRKVMADVDGEPGVLDTPKGEDALWRKLQELLDSDPAYARLHDELTGCGAVLDEGDADANA